MNKELICIECPKGCPLTVEVENCRVVKVTGNQCPKGERYAHDEIEDPKRFLTTTVLAIGLSLKVVPVRTDKPVPVWRIPEALSVLRPIRLARAVEAGDVLVDDLLGMGIKVIVTRQATARDSRRIEKDDRK